jgi:wobble nucleotide-excising tRNase
VLEKIVRIAGLAKFQDCSASGPVDFRKVTVVYAENGRGKSSIAQVIRSLSTRCSDYLEERRRLSDPGVIIELRVDGDNARYKNGRWEGPQPMSRVFDEQFVQENVYCGPDVSVENRRSLYELIIGEHGPELVAKYDSADADVTRLSGAIREKDAAILQRLQNISVADFCRHQPDANAARDLEVEEKQLSALQQLEAIRSRRQPQPIEVPTVPLDKIRSTLAYCKDDVDAGLEESVRAAAAVFVNGSGENWLQSGVQVTRNNRCPFCGQDVTKNRMLAAYRHYFSDAYSKIKKDIRECQEAVSSSLSEKVISQIRIVILSNASTAERWSDHPEIQEELVDPAQLDEVLTTACASLRQVLSAKECHPYDTPTSTMETLFQSALSKFTEATSLIQEYNASVAKVNEDIKAIKESLTLTDAEELTRKVKYLRDLTFRSLAEGTALADGYQTLLTEKATAESNKGAARSELGRYNSELPQAFMRLVNHYLERFGTEYRVVTPNVSYTGRHANATYCLQVEGESINLGTSSTAAGTPRFASALSLGDKNALALAVFCATLDTDSHLSEEMLVFDDPMTSLDEQRRAASADAIAAYFDRSNQVIVLSHDADFLAAIRRRCTSAQDCRELCIPRTATGSTIAPWDSALATKNEYFRDYQTLLDFLKSGEPDPGKRVAVQRCVRQVIEGNLRQRFPEVCRSGECLGNYIAAIRNATPQSSIHRLQNSLSNLAEINEYSTRAHHSEEGAPLQNPNETELRTFVTRSIEFVRGGGGPTA